MKVDWPAILAELEQRGIGAVQLSKMLERKGVSYHVDAVYKLARGDRSDPSHTVGAAILSIHGQQKNPRLSGLKRRDYQVNAEGHTRG